MQEILKIGLDFDGVIADSHSVKPIIAKELYGVDIVGPFSRENIVGKQLTLEQYENTKIKLYHGNYLIEPIKDAPFYIKKLIEDGSTIEIVTSRSDEILDRAIELLDKFDLSGISIRGVGYGNSKKSFCEGLDVFVEDDLDKLLPLVGTVKHLILFNGHENINHNLPDNIIRLDAWSKLYDYIKNKIRI